MGVSGIDLDVSFAGGREAATGGDLVGGSLAGEAFELGADTSDEESASVVIPTDDAGDSSLFASAADERLLPRSGVRGFPHWAVWGERTWRSARDISRLMLEGDALAASGLATRAAGSPARPGTPVPAPSHAAPPVRPPSNRSTGSPAQQWGRDHP